MNLEEQAAVMVWAIGSWPNYVADEIQRQVMTVQVGAMDQPVVMQSLNSWAREQFRFFPGWGAVAARAIEFTDRKDTSTEAVIKLQHAVKTVGTYGNPTFDDPAIEMTIKAMGGWQQVCASDAEWLPRNFLQLYKPLADRAAADSILPPGAKSIIEQARDGMRKLDDPPRKPTALGPAE